MRSYEERTKKLSSILTTARKIALHDPSCSAGKAAWEYLQFCIRHGCVAIPGTSSKTASFGNYLFPGRQGSPTTPTEAKKILGIMVHFSDEAAPGNPMNKITVDGTPVIDNSYVYRSENVNLLVLGYADRYTVTEKAIELLHEARHARDHFGGVFENIPELDPKELHESRTWKYWFDILDSCGGEIWQRAVEQEFVYVRSQYEAKSKSPGEKYCKTSGLKYRELDYMFGTPIPPLLLTNRSVLVGIRANFLLVERSHHPNKDAAYRNIVDAYYEWTERRK